MLYAIPNVMRRNEFRTKKAGIDMKMVKVLLFFVLVLSFLIGCSGQSTEETKNDQPASKASVDKGSGNSEKVTLHVSSWRVEEIEAFKKINAEFNKEYPNIEIMYEPIKATEYDSALNTALETETGPDLFYVRPFDRGTNIFKSGNLLELDKEKVPNLANINETQQAVYQDADKKLFAVPYIYVAYGFLYNEDLFKQHQVEVPKTWNQFYAALEIFQKDGIIPLALGTKDPWVLTEVVSFGNYSNFVGGEDWRKNFIAGQAKTTDPGFIDFLDNLQQWNKYMPDHFEGIGYAEAQQLFLAGQAAIFPSGSWEIGNFRAQNPDLKMGFFASPTKAEGDKQWVGLNGGAGLGVNPKSEHVNEALTYINWLAGEKAQILSGNLMAGLFPCAIINTDELTDPLAKDWLNSGGESGENFAIGWGLVKVSEGEPGAYQLASDNLPLLFNGDLTPEQMAGKIQEGLDTWFKP